MDQRDKLPWFPLWVDDFLAGTKDMEPGEVGIYVNLLCLQSQRGPLDEDDLKLIRRRWPDLVDAVLDLKFRQDDTGRWANPRMERERDERRKTRQRAVESGKRGAAKRWGGHGNPIASTTTTTTTKKKKKKPDKPDGPPIATPSPRDGKQVVLALELPFDEPDFRDAWEEFINFRWEKRKPITPTEAKRKLKTLGAMGQSRAIAALRHTTGMGWLGIREPEAGQLEPQVQPHAPHQMSGEEARFRLVRTHKVKAATDWDGERCLRELRKRGPKRP